MHKQIISNVSFGFMILNWRVGAIMNQLDIKDFLSNRWIKLGILSLTTFSLHVCYRLFSTVLSNINHKRKPQSIFLAMFLVIFSLHHSYFHCRNSGNQHELLHFSPTRSCFSLLCTLMYLQHFQHIFLQQKALVLEVKV